MRIRGNWVSLLGWRHFSRANQQLETSLGRLSSGLRVNSAADDAAGLAISQQILGQYRGLVRANRNAWDGISLVSTTESALNEIHSILQRGRELSLQAANGTLTDDERRMIQLEISQIIREINRIADTVSFNGQRLLSTGNSGAMAAALEGLRSGWLEQAEKVIGQWYQLFGDDVELQIVFEQAGPSATWISGRPGAGGVMDGLKLHINLSQFDDGGGSDGGTSPLFNDRKVARGLTQAVLARNANFAGLEDWLISGLSDYIPGRNEQVSADLATHGVDALINALDGPWQDTSLQQSAAYLAVRYLESRFLNGHTMASFLDIMRGSTLDIALFFTTGTYTSDEFLWQFRENGADFLNSITLNDDSDVGGIGGGDAVTVIPNGGTYRLDPLDHFVIRWPDSAQSKPVEIGLQVGANAYDMIRVVIPEVSSFSLGLIGVDVVTRYQQAIDQFGTAIDTVSSVRSYLGAMHNRLEHVIAQNGVSAENQLSGYSRIIDLDVARETANLARQEILVSSSAAMLAQANSKHEHVLSLLQSLDLGPRTA